MLVTLLLVAIAFTSPSEIGWSDAPPSLPKGTKVAILEGDPRAAGVFTMRLLVPAGSTVAPHWHPRAERVTVISGRAEVGFGDVVDRTKVKSFTAGGFYVNPPNSHHYLYFPEESILQLTCEGPWELNYVHSTSSTKTTP